MGFVGQPDPLDVGRVREDSVSKKKKCGGKNEEHTRRQFLVFIHIDENTKTKEWVRRMATDTAQLVKHLASMRKAQVQLLTFYKLGR